MTTPIENDIATAQTLLDKCALLAYDHALCLRVQANDKQLKRRIKAQLKTAVSLFVYGDHCNARREPTADDFAKYRMKLCRDMAHKLTNAIEQLHGLRQLCDALATNDAPPTLAEKQ